MSGAKPGGRTLGWAVVGCGLVAREYVIPALQGARNARLVALCDANAEALMRVQADGVNRYTALGSVLAAISVSSAATLWREGSTMASRACNWLSSSSAAWVSKILPSGS